jgi:hypothetical protein
MTGPGAMLSRIPGPVTIGPLGEPRFGSLFSLVSV